MGGASKKPISTMEKRQQKLAEAQQKKQQKKQVSKSGKEVISKNVVVSQDILNRVLDEIKKNKFITPYQLATATGITISVAKKMLEAIEKKGDIKLAAKNRRVSLYVAA
ncbi:MAG: 30S ribosomal protein S25e [Sulfolobaceae archaeon]|nr:30S ribosomal protein S25e [Sulfolobaceae archaeon]